MSDTTGIIWILVIVLVIFLLWLGRELTCWYLKINERIDLMKEQNNLLQFIASGRKLNDEADKDGESDKADDPLPDLPPRRTPLTR